jgi:hypothetical protein
VTCSNSNYRGKDNFEVDRVLAEKLLTIFPGMRDLVRDNRKFITRAVSWVAGQEIDQFIDLGAGLPTSPSTHESAQAVNPEASVVYVDNDPLVVNHARALLAKGNHGVTVAASDLREPATVFGSAELRSAIDLQRPVCLVLAAVLHLMDAESARRVAAEYVRNLSPGSYVIITMARYDDPGLGDHVMREYTAGTFFNHSHADAITFFEGLELVEPGLTSGRIWRGGMPDPGLSRGDVYPLVGVARKPGV